MADVMRQPGKGVTSVRPRRQSPAPERRRGDLLDAATSLFAAKGIEATSIADIAAAAGVAKGSFYRYFDSREELVAALKARFIDDLLAEVAGFAERIGTDDWWALSDDFVAAMVGALLARRDLIRIFSAQPGSDDTVGLFLEGEDRIDEFIAAGIRLGIDAGVFDVADPPLTATLLQHAISATVEHAIVHNVAVDQARLVSAAQRLVRAALGGS
jgi:AcrR family transcriptional regulator